MFIMFIVIVLNKACGDRYLLSRHLVSTVPLPHSILQQCIRHYLNVIAQVRTKMIYIIE